MSRLQQEALDAIRRQNAWAAKKSQPANLTASLRLMQQSQQQQTPVGNSHH